MMRFRINRSTYWTILLVSLAVIFGLVAAGIKPPGIEFLMVAVGIPRLHDIGRSGWYVAVLLLVEIGVVFGALFAGQDKDGILLVGGILVIVVLALATWLGLIKGDSIPNKWGDPPTPGINFAAGKAREH